MANEQARRIVWHKWINPFTGTGGEHDVDIEEEEDNGYKDSAEGTEDFFRSIRTPKMYKPDMGRVIASPLGYLPMEEHGDPAVIYDFWLMHTNFNISPKVQKIGSQIAGVEGWNTFSRYRARLAFGRLFNRSEVMKAVQESLGVGVKAVVVQEPSVREMTLEHIKKQLSATTPCWAILEYDSGCMQTIRGSEQEVRQNVENLKALPNHPRIITSWER